MARPEKLPPIHPGEILREDFMKPLGLSMNKLALDLHVPVTRIAEIVHERHGISPDTALRLGRYFNTSARFWLNAQAAPPTTWKLRRTNSSAPSNAMCGP
jgi:addiction module HigA family antidote